MLAQISIQEKNFDEARNAYTNGVRAFQSFLSYIFSLGEEVSYFNSYVDRTESSGRVGGTRDEGEK